MQDRKIWDTWRRCLRFYDLAPFMVFDSFSQGMRNQFLFLQIGFYDKVFFLAGKMCVLGALYLIGCCILKVTWYINIHQYTSHDISKHHMTSVYITWHHYTSVYITWHQYTSIYISMHHIASVYITWYQYTCTSHGFNIHHMTSIYIQYYTPTRREGAILQSPCPSVLLSVRSHFRNGYLSFYWKKWFDIWLWHGDLYRVSPFQVYRTSTSCLPCDLQMNEWGYS